MSIIESAGMEAVLPSHAEIAPFSVRPGKLPRSVILRAKAGPKGTRYDWHKSTDGGETWVDLGGTTQATKTVPDLEPGKTYWFRVRLLKPRLGFTDWSDKISIVVR